MRTLAFTAIVAAITLSAQVHEAEAQRTICKERAELVEILARKFNETQRSFGLQGDSRVLELYASPDGSWTALLTLPSGKSCVVASGKAWTEVEPEPVGEPA